MECGHSGRERHVGFDGETECIRCCVEEEVYGRQREQRRYEIARDAMAALIASDHYQFVPKYHAENALRCADALLKALEGESE